LFWRLRVITTLMPSLVYFTSHTPARLSGVLITAGYTVFEALEIAEVMYLCEHEKVDAIVIGSDIEEQDKVEIQLKRTTIKLKAETTPSDILWVLSNSLPVEGGRVQ
jgi:hypothetical protein